MTIRILCYSLTGNTGTLARQVAAELGAELHEIRADGPAKPGIWGLWGILRLAFVTLTGRKSRIEVPDVEWAGSDLLILAAPVWAGHVAAPMRTWLRGRPDLPDRVALIVTSGDPNRPDGMIAEFSDLAGRTPSAVLHQGEALVRSGAYGPAVGVFCAALGGGDAAPQFETVEAEIVNRAGKADQGIAA